MDIQKLTFFQKQYLSFFKDKRNKNKADIYHYIIKFVLANDYAPTIATLLKEFPNRQKTIVSILNWLIKIGLVKKIKYGADFLFIPILMPFTLVEEYRDELYTRYSGDKHYARSQEIKDKFKKVINEKFNEQRDDWANSFKESGYKDSEEYSSEETVDGYDEEELPPNFDDTENTSGMVVV